MADRIKGITIEIDGDTTKLESALKKVNGEIKTSQSNLKDINKLLKLDPGNTELLQQKYKNLGNEVHDVSEKLKTLKDAQSQMQGAGQTGTAEYDALQREIVETEQKLKSLTNEYKEFGSVQAQEIAVAGKKMQEAGGKIKGAGQAMMPVTAAITGIGAASVAASTDFDSSFAQLSTIADTNEVSADKLKKQIMDVSNEYGVAASDIAASTYSAISAGRSTGEAVAFVATATRAAKAGFTDSATSIDTLTTIMNAYGSSAGTADQISDRLLTTQNLGKTTFAELGVSMGKVIPTAAMYGVNLDNLASAYVTTTKNGIATAESTTYINGMLNELGKSGSTASKILKEDTGKSFKELMDGGASLSDVLKIVQDHADKSGMSIADCFGSQEAAKAAATIVQHSNDFTGALKAMGDSAGTTTDAFEKMDSTGAASMEKAKTAVHNAAIEIGTTLAPFVAQAANAIADMAREFTSLPASVQKSIVVVAAIIAVIGPLLIIIGQVMTGVGSIMTTAPKLVGGIKTIITAIQGIAAPFAGIIAIVGGVAMAVKNFVSMFQNGFSVIKSILMGIGIALAAVGAVILGAPAAVAAVIAAIVYAVANLVVVVKEHWQDICTFLTSLWATISATASSVWNGIKDAISSIVNAIKITVTSVWTAITTATSNAWNTVKTVVGNVLGNIKSSITSGMNAAKSTIDSVLTAIKSKFQSIWDGVKSIVSTALEKIKGLMNFHWELPKLKLPHFNISGSFSLNPPRVPHFGVEWYKKAMNGGMILNSPTIFGMQGGRLLGAGEAGSETVVGTSSLMNMIQRAVGENANTVTVNVYGAEGQDVRELADIVSERINSAIFRKAAVYA